VSASGADGSSQIDILTRDGSRPVLEEEARREATEIRSFLASIDRGVIPSGVLPEDVAADDQHAVRLLRKWVAKNEDLIDLRRREAEHFERRHRRLDDDQLWLFIERGHAMRDSLEASLATL
jgi:hypothetical protein